jgi:hypothetical protein
MKTLQGLRPAAEAPRCDSAAFQALERALKILTLLGASPPPLRHPPVAMTMYPGNLIRFITLRPVPPHGKLAVQEGGQRFRNRFSPEQYYPCRGWCIVS